MTGAVNMYMETFPDAANNAAARDHLEGPDAWAGGGGGGGGAGVHGNDADGFTNAPGGGEPPNALVTVVSYVAAAPAMVLRGGLSLVGAVLGLGWMVVHGVGSAVLPDAVMAPVRRAVASLASIAGPTDPDAAASAFVDRFEARYGAVRPPFQRKGCRAAILAAHRQSKFLLVYLHDQHSPAADRFAAGALTDPAVVGVMRDHVLVWGGDVASSWDAKQMARAVGSPRQPYMCLLSCPRDDQVGLVASWEGAVGAERLAQELLLSLERFGGEVEAARERRAEEERAREESRRLREEQDAALAAAMAADREREEERRRRAEAEAEERAAAERAEAEAEAARRAAEEREGERAAELERRRRDKAGALPEEPEAGTPGCCVIRVRLPGGANEMRRFADASPLSAVYDWVDSLEQSEHLEYDLASSFPRKTFPRSESAAVTLAEAGLAPQAVLFVQPAASE